MDEATFLKELSKYKVIRSTDYTKPKQKSKAIKSNPAPTIATKENQQSSNPTLPLVNSTESNFWELLSATNSTILTAAESIKFIEAMKAVRWVNLFSFHLFIAFLNWSVLKSYFSDFVLIE
jgi:hypothetical protein